jgi:uncharacterized membrane protein YdjX (TVP38/TMEM64 family)
MTILHHWRLIVLLLAGATIAAVVLLEPAWVSGLAGQFSRDAIAGLVARAGVWGPVLIVALMTIAVVISPIPSAPIALAAGAAYGHGWGTLYVLAGAETGALIAFGLARLLGRETLRRWFGDERLDIGLLGSQNLLMFTVFASRLMPFLSFDLVSYAAGLSGLAFWRFGVATLAGIVPASFVLTHFGGEVATANFGAAMWAVLGLGLVTGLPLIWAAFKARKRTPQQRGSKR